MKASDDLTKSTLRVALSAITNAEVAGDEAIDLSDDQIVKVLQAESKKRLESAEIYEQNGRAEAAAKEKAEADPTLDPSLFNRPKDYKGKGPAN